MTNRLAHETSPYLLQHADNPVEWYPWGPEAFERARDEDKPILLSIGYSACHWCHVMAHESFENPEIAAMMNDLYVNVKVDREERPDVDAIYMAAVQTMTGQGGWPMTVFLTPEGKPFYGGTYYPPDDRGGMPGFKRILQGVNEAYRDRHDQVSESADRLSEHLNHQFHAELPGAPLEPGILNSALDNLQRDYDETNGGFGDAPKFPAAMAAELLLRAHHRLDDDRAINMLHHTLDAMARGGLYDQVGGGFHRYTVDAIWLVPHFEKMLYDNALLAHVYAAAYQHTGETFYRAIVEETLDYVLDEMTSPEGGFYSTQDADTEGEEGKFYVWTQGELRAALGDDADNVIDMLGVTVTGNFEGSNVLSIPNKDDRLRWREPEFAELRRKLQAARSERTHPGRDEKILTSWNGLMLRAFAYAARVLDDEEYLDTARSNANFLRENLANGARLFHSFKEGDARIDGFLEDYAYLVDGLVEVYMASFESEWLVWAEELAREAIALFYDENAGMFFDTPETAKDLIARPRELTDNAVPSGTSVICESLLRLGMLTGEADIQEIALDTLADFSTLAGEHAYGLSRMLCAIDTGVGPSVEVALIGDDIGPMLDALRGEYLPRVVIAGASGAYGDSSAVALLDGREMIEGQATAYVCVNHACQMPTTDPQQMLEQIRVAVNAPSATPSA